jgi:dihydroorotate dehydrogenase
LKDELHPGRYNALMYELIRPLLFCLDPERAQSVAVAGLRAFHFLPGVGFDGRVATAEPPVELFGLRFRNRVGLAAGFDKSAKYVDTLAHLGFGFIEVGTVTPRPQPGNPRPNLFRLPEDEALINRMGFPNEGAAVAARRLEKRRYTGVCGVNIGKNFDTPLAEAAKDYVSCLRTVYAVADYVTVNISSPNTAGLRDLQNADVLRALVLEVAGAREQLQPVHGKRVPILIKLAPDLSQTQLQEIAVQLRQLPVDGVIATNTTTTRPASLRSAHATQQGGLSGRPLRELSLQAVGTLRQHLGPDMPMVGVGGIFSANEGRAMLAAGANLLQVYTGLVYRGPGLVRSLIEGAAR